MMRILFLAFHEINICVSNHLNRLNEAILMITHNIPFEDEMRQICLNKHKYIYVWSYEIIFLGTREQVQTKHDKHVISVQATEVLLYMAMETHFMLNSRFDE